MKNEEIHAASLEAERLRADPALAGALITMRREALEALAKIDATETDKIRDAQAKVRAIDGLTTEIATAILRWKALPPDQQKQITG